MKVSLTGFREFVRSNVPVSISNISRVDVTLEVGTLSETVTVASEAQLLQTDKADVHTEIKSAELTAMPLNRFRNYQALMNLVPGTTPMAFGNAETDTPARSLATNVNGQVNTNNSTRTDGATNMNVWLPNHEMYISPAETVDTVNVSTSSFDAEQGMAGGAAITVITKSGTNNFKGSAFEFYNGDRLNATPAFFGGGAGAAEAATQAEHLRRHVRRPVQEELAVLLRIHRGLRTDQSLFTFFSVPDASAPRGGLQRREEHQRVAPADLQPVLGQCRRQRTFAVHEQPDSVRHDRSDCAEDHAALPAAQHHRHRRWRPDEQLPAVGDPHDRSQELRLQDELEPDLVAPDLGQVQLHERGRRRSDELPRPPDRATGDGGFTKVWQATGGQTWTFTPTMLMDMTFGFSRQNQQVSVPTTSPATTASTSSGFPARTTRAAAFGFEDRYAGYPQFNTGFSDVGNRDGWNPIFRDERTYSLTTNLTKVKGRHDIRGGYTLNYFFLDHWQPETGNPRGNFIFNGDTTELRGNTQTSNFYNQYASFLLGLVGNVNKSVQNELMTAREWQHALYIRDRWTPSPKLTLDLGMRYELYPIMHRADGRGLDRLDLSTLDVLIAGRGGNPQNNGMKMSWNNFAPRLGAIYRLNEQTVFRAGYGVTYNATPWARAVRGDNDYPITIASTFVNKTDKTGFG